MLGLFAILAGYGLAVLIVHAYYRRTRRSADRLPHIVFVTKNNQSQIEWYLRSLGFLTSLKGRRIATTVFDEGSTDDTLKIVERLSFRQPMQIDQVRHDHAVDDFLKLHEQEQVIVVRLSQQDHAGEWLQQVQ